MASLPYEQSFDGQTLGKEWRSKGGRWDILESRLFNNGARNSPLWLSVDLPDDVRVSFKAESKSPAVDIKFEIFGDGEHHQSGYVVILSGWNNSKSIIARLDEHGPERQPAQTSQLRAAVAADAETAAKQNAQRHEIKVRRHKGEANHVYDLRLERRGNTLQFFVDGALHVEYFDPAPLRGPGNNRFAFSNWASEVFFDDLLIEAL